MTVTSKLVRCPSPISCHVFWAGCATARRSSLGRRRPLVTTRPCHRAVKGGRQGGCEMAVHAGHGGRQGGAVGHQRVHPAGSHNCCLALRRCPGMDCYGGCGCCHCLRRRASCNALAFSLTGPPPGLTPLPSPLPLPGLHSSHHFLCPSHAGCRACTPSPSLLLAPSVPPTPSPRLSP